MIIRTFLPLPLITLILAALLLTAPASAANPIATTSGDTWIGYSWNSTGTYALYLDGTLTENNTPLEYYLISDLPAGEQHILEVRNATTGDLIGTATAATLPAAGTMIFLLLIQMALMYFVFVSRDLSFGILTGGASFVIGAYVLLGGASQFWAVLIALLLLILTGLATIKMIYTSLVSKRWF